MGRRTAAAVAHCAARYDAGLGIIRLLKKQQDGMKRTEAKIYLYCVYVESFG